MNPAVWASAAAFAVLPFAAIAGDAPELDCHDPAGTMDADLCASQAFEQADTQLNRAYHRALSALRPGNDFCGTGCNAAADELILAQRAWIQFRDHDCSAVHAVWIDGTGRNQAQMKCLIDHTQNRTEQLQALLED